MRPSITSGAPDKSWDGEESSRIPYYFTKTNKTLTSRQGKHRTFLAKKQVPPRLRQL